MLLTIHLLPKQCEGVLLHVVTTVPFTHPITKESDMQPRENNIVLIILWQLNQDCYDML